MPLALFREQFTLFGKSFRSLFAKNNELRNVSLGVILEHLYIVLFFCPFYADFS